MSLMPAREKSVTMTSSPKTTMANITIWEIRLEVMATSTKTTLRSSLILPRQQEVHEGRIDRCRARIDHCHVGLACLGCLVEQGLRGRDLLWNFKMVRAS